MALKNGSSGGIVAVDLAYAMEALEAMNQGFLVITVRLKNGNGAPHIILTGTFFGEEPTDQEQKPLVSTSVDLMKERYSNLTNAAFRIVYSVDGLLADRELKENNTA